MTSQVKRRPNVILAMCDDLGWGDVGFNGAEHIRTPHLDELASEAVRFTRFYAGGPVCSPTRGTCLTGRHYIRYGVNHANRGRLPVQEISLAGLCREAGYATGHFGKWHLGTLTVDEPDSNRGGPEHPLEYSPPWLHGFETCFSTEAKVPTWDPMLAPDETGPRGPKWGTPGEPFGTHYWDERGRKVRENLDGCDSARIMDRAEAFIREASGRDQPFLAVIWFHAPHTPVVAGPQWRAMYPDASEQEQHYFGCVSAMDAQMGRLAGLLDELGQADDTLLWFCSDNGPEGVEDLSRNGRSQGRTGGLRGRKRSLYDGGVGVPGLLRYPAKLTGGKTVTSPCSTLDMLPTICGLIGEAVPDDRPIDGTDIWPIVSGQSAERDKAIPYRFLEREEQMFGAPTFAWMQGRWKFLTNLDAPGEHDQLYDMESDRGETTNVLGEHLELGQRFRAELAEFVESCRRSHAGADYDEPVDMITPFQEPGGWAVGRP